MFPVKLIAETLEELDLHTRPLSPKALPCSASPLHPSVLDSLPLHNEELLESHALLAKRRKTAVDDPSGREGGLGSRAREFVQTAALGAVLDEVEEDQKHELACGEHTGIIITNLFPPAHACNTLCLYGICIRDARSPAEAQGCGERGATGACHQARQVR